jgi:hypothetical protein
VPVALSNAGADDTEEEEGGAIDSDADVEHEGYERCEQGDERKVHKKRPLNGDNVSKGSKRCKKASERGDVDLDTGDDGRDNFIHREEEKEDTHQLGPSSVAAPGSASSSSMLNSRRATIIYIDVDGEDDSEQEQQDEDEEGEILYIDDTDDDDDAFI